MNTKRNVVVNKRKLDKELIAKAKPLRDLDMLAVSLKQEQLLKQEASSKEGKSSSAQEFDEWE